MLELAQAATEGGDPTTQAARYRAATIRFFRADLARGQEARLDAAVRELAGALEETPDWGWIAWNIERAAADAIRAGRFDVALAAARALSSSPRFQASGRVCEARVHLAQGDLGAAQAAVVEAGRLDPAAAGLREIQEEIAARRGDVGGGDR
jgi:hypothetical protein